MDGTVDMTDEEGDEEDDPVSNDDTEHSVISVASGHPRGILF